ncbi:MAG TPA: hypothetical protein DEP01_02340 [Aminobacterium sp.]|jgi:hypothetical protein|uniref:hypothetical protein n=2 Tax=Aminobacteriaceae TaxID=3029087 RepID=UPI000EC90445|nr:MULTISPECIES: hypothetical protein [unclassified Aminobacterium]HCA40445.1 hypothetical protein [Aminobacterium sp.]
MVDLSIIGKASDLWTYWGFESWSFDHMQGVSRRVTFVKDSILGEIGRYYAYDFVIWIHNGCTDAEYIFANWEPLPDVMTQRFVFLEPFPSFDKKIKTFFWGFKGYLELYSYTPLAPWNSKIKDLAPLVNKAQELEGSLCQGGDDIKK